MGLKDLENAGVTLPRDQWGKHVVRTGVNRPAFLTCSASAVAGTVLMYLGDGGVATWLGAPLYLVSLFLAAALSFRAVLPDRELSRHGRDT